MWSYGMMIPMVDDDDDDDDDDENDGSIDHIDLLMKTWFPPK